MFVYVIGSESGPFKVGITKNLAKRLSIIQLSHFEKLTLRAYLETETIEEARWIEATAHKRLAPFHASGEWFRCDFETVTKAIGNPAIGSLPSKPNLRHECYEMLLNCMRQVPATTLRYLAKLHSATTVTPEAVAEARTAQIWPQP